MVENGKYKKQKSSEMSTISTICDCKKIFRQKKQSNQRLNTEQMNTIGQPTNDRTGAETGLKPKQRHMENNEQMHTVLSVC